MLITVDLLKEKGASNHMIRWFSSHVGSSASYKETMTAIVKKNEERLGIWMMNNFDCHSCVNTKSSISTDLLMYAGNIESEGSITAKRIIVMGNIKAKEISAQYIDVSGVIESSDGIDTTSDIICGGLKSGRLRAGASLRTKGDVLIRGSASIQTDMLSMGDVIADGSIFIGGILKAAGMVKPGKGKCLITGACQSSGEIRSSVHFDGIAPGF